MFDMIQSIRQNTQEVSCSMLRTERFISEFRNKATVLAFTIVTILYWKFYPEQ